MRYADVWRARLALMRPANALLSALGVLVGIAHVAGNADQVARYVAASTWLAAPLAAAFIAAAGNVLNDILDRRLDRIAHPTRPLAAGLLTVGHATALAIVLLALGLLEAYLAGGVPTLVFAIGVAAGLALYEWRLKRLPLAGNLLIGALVAATVPFGALASGGLASLRPLEVTSLWGLTLLAFMVNVARELWKDLEDGEADRSHRHTMARYPRLARWGGAALVILAVALVPSVWTGVEWWLLWDMVLAASLVTFIAAVVLPVARGQRLLKWAMLLALLAFFFGSLTHIHPAA